MRQITAAQRGAGPRDALPMDYQLFHVEADLCWMDHAAGRLDTLAGSAT